jgi:hypothetical protein
MPCSFGLFNLETTVQNDKVMQDLELDSFLIGADHSQKVKAVLSKMIMAQEIALICRLQLSFLGLKKIALGFRQDFFNSASHFLGNGCCELQIFSSDRMLKTQSGGV